MRLSRSGDGGDVVRKIAGLTGLVALAGCQTIQPHYGLSYGANTGQLTHRFTGVELGKAVETGYDRAIYFTEVFSNRSGSEIHLTESQICFTVTGACHELEYDITVPAGKTANLDSHLSTNQPLREGYTETYFGSDATGSAVALTVNFRPETYFRSTAVTRAPTAPQPTAGAWGRPASQ
jgi:hypothetical protein